MRMKQIILMIGFVFVGLISIAQTKKYDSTMKIGKAGYRIICNNKSAEKNSINIAPIGFESGVRDITIDIKGTVNKAEVDDFNRDGFPDVVLYIFNGGVKNMGSVLAISSNKNEGMNPIFFPDLLDDAKLKQGYYGHDEFALIEGTIMRKFPLYNMADSSNISPNGNIRFIQYKLTYGEGGMMRFKMERTFDRIKP